MHRRLAVAVVALLTALPAAGAQQLVRPWSEPVFHSWQLGPAGGPGGAPFSDVCEVEGLVVRSGYWIDGVQLLCRGGVAAPHRGGWGGGADYFYLEPGERILAIEGTFEGGAGPWVYSLRVITDRRVSPEYGHGGPVRGIYPFRFDVPPGAIFTGLHGRAGLFLDAIGLTYSTVAAPRWPAVAPTPIYPAYGGVADNGCTSFGEPLTYLFEWSEVPEATRYHLRVARPGSLNPAVDRADLVQPVYREDRRAYVADHLLDGWEWTVRALVDGVWSPWSAPHRFRHEPADTDCAEPPRSYRIETQTGHRLGAGTDADVYIKMRGTRGESGWIPLHCFVGGNPFEAGYRDLAVLDFARGLGEIRAIALRNDGGGHGPDWYVDWIFIGSGDRTGRSFHVSRWLETGTSTAWID